DFNKAYSDASYTLSEFKRDVIEQLTKKYGLMVGMGTKAVPITGTASRRDADVLVAAQHRRYYAFTSMLDQRYADGIYFFASNGTRIINFPKQHTENCTTKHQGTGQWFKPMVRVLKNMR